MRSLIDTAAGAFFSQKLTESEFSAFNSDSSLRPEVGNSSRNQSIVADTDLLKNVNSLMSKRISTRIFMGIETSEAEVKELVRLAYGYFPSGHRTIPSAGGLYSLRINIARLEDGKIHELLTYSPDLAVDFISHEVSVPVRELYYVHHVGFEQASWVIFWSCKLLPIAAKYGAKGYRFACLEIGHSAQLFGMGCISNDIEHIFLGGINEKAIRCKLFATGRRYLPQYSVLIR